MNKGILTLIGFLLFCFGILSIVLSMIGIQFSFLAFLDAPGRLFGFVMKLLMIIGGVVIVVLTRTNWQEEN